MAEKVEYIEPIDKLNTGRNKINEFAIKPALNAEKNSNDAKNIATESNQISSEAKDIAANTDGRLDNIVAGEMDDAEVIDARGSYPVLSKRLDDMPKKSDIQLPEYSSSEPLGGLRDVFKPKLQQTLTEIDDSKFNYASMFDLHYDRGAFIGGDILRYSLTHIFNVCSLSSKLDAIIFGGDNSDLNSIKDAKRYLYNQQEQVVTTALSLSECPVWFLKGNHDDGSIQARLRYDRKMETNIRNKWLTPDFVLTDEDFAKLYQQTISLYGENRNNTSNYFYKDFDDKKVRLIGLDSADLPETLESDGTLKYPRQYYTCFSSSQIDWLANQALIMPEAYTAIVVLHHPIHGTLATYKSSDNPYDTTLPCINHDVVKTLFEQYQAKGRGLVSQSADDNRVPVSVNYDFSSQTGAIALVHCGHIHVDTDLNQNSVLYVSTCCSMGMSTEYNRGQDTFDTLDEECFDVVSVDTNAKTINLKRVGAGNDREFDY